MIVSPVGKPQESHVYELPDRSLFVHVVDPNQQGSGPGISISGGIQLDFSQLTEMYGSDLNISSLLGPAAGKAHPSEVTEPAWRSIRLQPVGTEHRMSCGFQDCRRPIVVRRSFVCGRCQGVMCPRHRDDDQQTYCKLCAEDARAEQFEAARKQVGTLEQAREDVAELTRITNPQPVFSARVWTERGTRPTTRDIATVPRDSKGCYRIGEQFSLNIQADRDCYLTLVDIGTSGNVCVLLKNYPVSANASVALSGPDDSRAWVIGGPAGIERIKAFFAEEARDLFPGVERFTLLGPADAPGEVVARFKDPGVMLGQMSADSWTDASCEFVVSER